MVVGFTTTCAISVYHHYSCEFEPRSWWGVLDTTLSDKVCQWLATGRWFSQSTPISSTNKTDRHYNVYNWTIFESDVKYHNHNFDFYFSKLNGPEPEYHNIVSGYKTFTSPKPFPLKYNSAVLPEVTIVYETWGKLNENKDNVVLIHAGLSASSHAKSHEVSVIHESITWF
jgi:hypothetical protein